VSGERAGNGQAEGNTDRQRSIDYLIIAVSSEAYFFPFPAPPSQSVRKCISLLRNDDVPLGKRNLLPQL
jgi:hypothetical protein